MRLSVTQFDQRGKRILLRADFNVPPTGDQIADDARIHAVIPTLEHCLTWFPSPAAAVRGASGGPLPQLIRVRKES